MENLASQDTYGLYKKLFVNEQYSLMPDDAFKIGTLTFEVQSYNTGIFASIGQRENMEDAFCSV